MTIRGGAGGASLKAHGCEGEKSRHLGHRDRLVYPSRTRNAEGVAVLEDRSPASAGLLSKPSDGLEPSTPSLPSSNEVGSKGKRGSRRPKKSRKSGESIEDE
jgi:hypothetical protein